MITYREDKVRTLDELVAEFSVEEATMSLSQDLEESRSENHENARLQEEGLARETQRLAKRVDKTSLESQGSRREETPVDMTVWSVPAMAKKFGKNSEMYHEDCE